MVCGLQGQQRLQGLLLEEAPDWLLLRRRRWGRLRLRGRNQPRRVRRNRRLCGEQRGSVVFRPTPVTALSPRLPHSAAHEGASSPAAPPGAIAPLSVLSFSFFKLKQRSFGLC